ncbi:MAG: N-acetylglucosamine-6-phosphate deacetylase [Verrucomicrobiaceae bacterium]|nr:N-acetylglucosamine-6-phosphate deacetylase [Verrucomicrobiaceae bacterium]
MKTFDLQVNGYAGVDFNREGLTGEKLHHACATLEKDGNEGILATIITDSMETMRLRLSNITELRRQSPLIERIIRGFHIEGPFLNESPGYIGAHPPEHAKQACPEEMKQLLDAASGLVRLVTLAPERDPGFTVTSLLNRKNITVAAGHCNPSLNELRGAIDSGLTMFTHLGNGCPMLMHRHDNIIQRVLSLSDELFISFIPDGAHIPFPALANYLKLVPAERAIAVTDAISAARLPPGQHTLGRWQLDIGEDLIAMAPDGSHLVGSTLTMPRAINNLQEETGLRQEAIEAMLYHNPLAVISNSNETRP